MTDTEKMAKFIKKNFVKFIKKKILETMYQLNILTKSLRNGVLFVLAWVACLREWRGKRGWRACVGDVLAWVAWVACLRGWRASVGGVGGVLAWVTC